MGTPNSVTVRVPASSANLGPGFDAFAIAIDLWLEVTVSASDQFSLVTDLAVPKDRSNLLIQAFEQLLSADTYRFEVSSEIPLAGGLGSSAAASVAGLAAAAALGNQDTDLLALATDLEGHPDNAAAALAGGGVICLSSDRQVRLNLPADLACVLLVPNDAVTTEAARGALPSSVPLADAVFNLSHASALALALERGDYELLGSALKDRLHEDFRASLFPQSSALLKEATKFGAVGATVSGAGPTVMFWTRQNERDEVAKRLNRQVQGWAEVVTTGFTGQGLRVEN